MKSVFTYANGFFADGFLLRQRIYANLYESEIDGVDFMKPLGSMEGSRTSILPDYVGFEIWFSMGVDWERGHLDRIIPCEALQITSTIENHSPTQIPLIQLITTSRT